MNKPNLNEFNELLGAFVNLSGTDEYKSMLMSMFKNNLMASLILIIIAIVYWVVFVIILVLHSKGLLGSLLVCLYILVFGMIISILFKHLKQKVYKSAELYAIDHETGWPWLHFKTKRLYVIIKDKKYSRRDINSLLFILNQKLDSGVPTNTLADYSMSIGINFLFVCIGVYIARLNNYLVFLFGFITFAILVFIVPSLLELFPAKQKKLLELKNSLLWIQRYPQLLED